MYNLLDNLFIVFNTLTFSFKSLAILLNKQLLLLEIPHAASCTNFVVGFPTPSEILLKNIEYTFMHSYAFL